MNNSRHVAITSSYCLLVLCIVKNLIQIDLTYKDTAFFLVTSQLCSFSWRMQWKRAVTRWFSRLLIVASWLKDNAESCGKCYHVMMWAIVSRESGFVVIHRAMGWHGFCTLKRSVNRCERFKKRLKWNNNLSKWGVSIKKNSTFVVSFRRRKYKH